jgi:L-alanine-DL-glutamate epimerase-like enolase superfamily enzyme
MRALLQKAKSEGCRHYKLKVGGDLKRDMRRLGIVREVIGWDNILMLDSNQVSISFPYLLTIHIRPGI